MLQIAIGTFIGVLRGNSMIMSIDDKSNPLVYTQKITNSIMNESSLLGNKSTTGIKSSLH